MSALIKKWLEFSGKSLVFKRNSQSGQALVIILLVLAVASTIAISLASRSVTDISITTKERESARAFSAAEAGVEEALIGGSTAGTLAGGETFSVTSGTAGGTTDFLWPDNISSGETVGLWLVGHDASGNLICDGAHPCFTGSSLKVCWGESGSAADQAQTPAISASVIYLNTPDTYSTARVARATSDPNSARRASNSFSGPPDFGCSINGKSFAWGQTINLASLGIPAGVYNTQNGLQTIRIRMIYNTSTPHPVAFQAGSAFPIQGTNITSTGQAEGATRKIELLQTFAAFPPIFDFGVFPGGAITK